MSKSSGQVQRRCILCISLPGIYAASVSCCTSFRTSSTRFWNWIKSTPVKARDRPNTVSSRGSFSSLSSTMPPANAHIQGQTQSKRNTEVPKRRKRRTVSPPESGRCILTFPCLGCLVELDEAALVGIQCLVSSSRDLIDTAKSSACVCVRGSRGEDHEVCETDMLPWMKFVAALPDKNAASIHLLSVIALDA